jgi:hypothetical protein
MTAADSSPKADTQAGARSVEWYSKPLRPFIVVLLVILAAVGIAGALPRGAQTGIIADILLTVLILCPLTLCLFPLYLVLVFLVVQMGRAHQAVGRGMARLNGVTVSARSRTERVADGWAKRSIRVNSVFAPLDRLIFSLFDPPQSRPDNTTERKDTHE